MAKILIVDTESTVVAALRSELEKERYEVHCANDGDEGLRAARDLSPDLVILDLLLPGKRGLEVCRTLRSESTVPIIILTANTDEVDRVVSLELGADDYLTKPFSMKELIARVRARLRRRNEGASTPPAPQLLTAGPLEVDLDRREASVSGRTLDLRPKEFDLLVVLMQSRGRVVSRAHLLKAVWNYEGTGQTRTLDVHVGRLRRKIGQESGDTAWISTVRGVGYRFID